MKYYGMNRETYLKNFPKPEWASEQLIRWDRGNMVEDICEHGCGHPNKVWMQSKYNNNDKGIHGCCGCCCKEQTVE